MPTTLREAGQQHFEDVLALVPNLNWAGDTSRPRYFQIRGIGELEQYQGAPNPSVGFLIDDIDFSGLGSCRYAVRCRSHRGAARSAGPCATAPTRSAVSFMHKAPSLRKQLGGRVELGAGNYGERAYGAVLTGPGAGARLLIPAGRAALQQATATTAMCT